MILQRIKALFFSIEFILSIILVVIFMAIFRPFIHPIRRTWAIIQRFFGRYKIVIDGYMDSNAQIILMNHTSMLDIVVMEEVSPKNLCWVAKKEIEKIPIIGNILKIPKMIPLDRSDPRAVVKMLKEAKERLSEGRVIAIFPEGTRGDGKRLLRFKNGAKLLTEKLNLKAQPVLIIGSNILDSKRFLFGSGVVKIVFLPVIDTTNPEWLSITRTKMQEYLDIELNKKAKF